MKKRRIFFFGAFTFFNTLFIFNVDGQTSQRDSLSLRISLPGAKVSSSEDLKIKIELRNISKAQLDVYQYISEGYMGDPQSNFYFQVEREDSNEFKLYDVRSHYQRAPNEDSDYIPRITLTPKDSLLFFYHVCNSYAFDPGRYRIRGVFNNRMPKEDYVYSNWVYFTVMKHISPDMHVNELLQKAEVPGNEKNNRR